MNLKDELLKEIYNMCYHHKHKEDGSGKLAKMVCDKIDHTKSHRQIQEEERDRQFNNFLKKKY